MPSNNASATSHIRPVTMLATEIFNDLDDSVEEVNSWLAIYRRLVRTAPPSLLEIAQTTLDAMHDVYTKRVKEQDQVGAELVGAERGRAMARVDFVAKEHGLYGIPWR
ncbi:uncharacterized protein PHACADRAFT_202058 [Phanerochaete carnosa HHB-10118-sp]|uniref:Uncharacterized protein n=1 Tax=Phanerochaete carnosa (strain HHB-10118-sp) TaxID=650164 RepID=K5UHR4_PHACS|nr:uncharacterized protein PHACADRAFT_202058 [Phanerochaete carnosa HHB-10118-sp]EKM49066.1 hypothetical protein PHACADRAFT_202058 [Phanerochaete carnosa HHB-10118-sp]